MRAFSVRWSPDTGWNDAPDAAVQHDVQLLLAFGPVQAPPVAWFVNAATRWPNARLVYTTTGGQIEGLDVVDRDVVVAGLAFDSARVNVIVRDDVGDLSDVEMGRALGAAIKLGETERLALERECEASDQA